VNNKAPPSFAQAMAEVRRRVRAARSSFTAGMATLPIPRREAMYALYAFCREVDDIADDSPTAATREEGLAQWQQRIKNLFGKDEADEAISVALRPAIKRFNLIEDDFQAIIEGMIMDSRQSIIAPPLAYLDEYCDHVASAVGRISVRIFGDDSAAAMKVAHHLGRALQLTNILRDLAEDAQRNRLYLPQELLTKNGITSNDPASVLSDPRLAAVCMDLAAIAREHFQQADLALLEARWYPMRPARAMRDYYKAILERLIKSEWKTPHQRMTLPLWQKIWLALRGLLR